MGVDSTSQPVEPEPPEELKELWRQRTLELRRARANALLAKNLKKLDALFGPGCYNDVDAEHATESRKFEIEESEKIKKSWLESGVPLPTKVPDSPIPFTRLCEVYRMVDQDFFTTDMET